MTVAVTEGLISLSLSSFRLIMGKLTCHCLNISVHTKVVPSALNITALRLSSEEQDDTFFKSQVAEIQLDLGGVAEVSVPQFHIEKLVISHYENLFCLKFFDL